jgi:uncharacterized membrane protein YtjA (UPF0391 family)
MFKYAVVFLIISLIAGALGLTNISRIARRVSLVLFALFFLAFLAVLGLAVLVEKSLQPTPAVVLLLGGRKRRIINCERPASNATLPCCNSVGLRPKPRVS